MSSNVFASDVHKQSFMQGVQDDNNDSLPMKSVAEITTENAEYIINRYGSNVHAQSTPNSTYRRSAGFTYGKDKKSIDQEATVTDEITYKELMREGFNIEADRTKKNAYALSEAIHRHAASVTRLGATSQLDNEVLAGTTAAGTVITLSDSNPDNVAATAIQILQEQKAYSNGNPYAMMTPKAAKNFNLFSMGAGFGTADAALQNSIFSFGAGTRMIQGARGFGGLDVIVTTEMPRTQTLTFASFLTAADTLTINGVVYTGRAVPSTAGEVDIAASAEAQIDLLVAAINNSSDYAAGIGSATAYFEVSQANRSIFDAAGVRARKVSATVMEVESFVALTISKSASTITLGVVREHMLIGARGSTTIALPSKGMRTDEKQLPAISGTGVNGFELTTFQMHDSVVWTKDGPKIVDVFLAA